MRSLEINFVSRKKYSQKSTSLLTDSPQTSNSRRRQHIVLVSRVDIILHVSTENRQLYRSYRGVNSATSERPYIIIDGTDGGGWSAGCVVCQGRQMALPHLTSPEAESILAQACENESNNAKRMRIGLEALSVCTTSYTINAIRRSLIATIIRLYIYLFIHYQRRLCRSAWVGFSSPSVCSVCLSVCLFRCLSAA